MTAARTLSTKGKATRLALEDAARTLFAERGFHGTTLSDITAAAGKSPAAFYRYFDDKEDLLVCIAEDFLREIHEIPMLGEDPGQIVVSDDRDFFASAVRVYWRRFKPNIGIMVAIDQLAATEPRFAALQNQFRRYGMDIVGTSVRTAQQQGHAAGLDADHVALAIALLFERFTSVSLSHGLSDEAAIATLCAIWKKTLYGDTEEKR